MLGTSASVAALGGASVTATAVADVLGDALQETGVAAGVVTVLQEEAPVLREDLEAGATWTASAGLGSATAATLTLGLGAGVSATTNSDEPRLTAPHGRDAWQIEYIARLAVFTGGSTTTFAPLFIADSSGNAWLFVQVRGDGDLSVYGHGSGTPVAAVSTAVALDGTGWLRVTIRDGEVAVYTGTGSAGSQAWTRRYRGAPAFPSSASSAYDRLRAHIYESAGGSSKAVQWADVEVRSL